MIAVNFTITLFAAITPSSSAESKLSNDISSIDNNPHPPKSDFEHLWDLTWNSDADMVPFCTLFDVARDGSLSDDICAHGVPSRF